MRNAYKAVNANRAVNTNRAINANRASNVTKAAALLLASLMLLLSACGGSGSQPTSGAATTAAAQAAAESTTAASTEAATTAAQKTDAATTTASTEAATTAAQTTEAATEPAATEPAAEPEDNVIKEATLSVFMPSAGGYEPGSMQQEVFDEIYKRIYEQTGFKVKFNVLSADYADAESKGTLLVATNQLDMLGSYYSNAKAKGHLDSDEVFYPYTMDTLKKYGPHFLEFMDRTHIKDITDSEGRIKLLTVKTDPSGAAVGNFLPWIRKDLLDKAGLGIPKTYSEVMTALDAFRQINPDIVAADCEYGDEALFTTMFYGIGVPEKQTDENGDLLPVIRSLYYFKTPEYREYLSAISRLYQDGYMGDEFYIWDSNKKQENMNAGNTGVWVQGWWMQKRADRYADLLPDDPRPEGVQYMNWVPMNPVTDDGRPMMIGYTPAAFTEHSFFVFKCTKYPEACLAVVDWTCISIDNAILTKFGIEGKQWELKGGAIATIPENEGSYNNILGDLLSYPNMGEAVERQWRGTRTDFMMAYDHVNTKFLYALASLPVYNLEPLGTLPGDLNTIFNERITKIITGELPLDALDKLIADLDAAGFQKYMDVVNSHWREYTAKTD